MDPMRFMESKDEMDVAIMQAIAEETMRLLEQRDENLAILISNAVWSAVK
jgi:hypothetical protein